MVSSYSRCLYLFFLLPIIWSMTPSRALSQTKKQSQQERCATMQVLEERFLRNPYLRIQMQQQNDEFNKALETGHYKLKKDGRTSDGYVTIPVVFHIVMTDPSAVTNQQIQSQLDTLNKSFSGTNGDSVRIPSYFKSLFGKSGLQFCLAQRTPDNEPTSGIVRYATNVTNFGIDDAVKNSSSGGANAWNTEKYLNIWICRLSDNVLGYATFPEDGSPQYQGLVIDYSSLPGGTAGNYNSGKILVHEAGHYFNLYHIWGDDNGSCSGTDYVNDTPNQANYTQGCFTGTRTDNCTPSGNGIMYQNYMDYSFDNCLVMFTPAQVERMEAAYSLYRSLLTGSEGCSPVVLKNLDVSPVSIQQPGQRICDANFTPVITIRNRGSQTISSLKIAAKVDNGQAVEFTWNGSLGSLTSASITLNSLTVSPGRHTLTVYTSNPNNSEDDNKANDTLQFSFLYSGVYSLPITEGFEGNIFPPQGWDVLNRDQSYTWSKVTGVARSGNASVYINNYAYQNIGQKDYLRLPEFQFNNEDSVFLSFDLAAAVYSPLNLQNNVWDTLEVSISSDCGNTYTSVYKKWGSDLVTVNSASTTAFVPTAGQWRKDSINLTPFLQNGRYLIAFTNTTGWENNIYLDNINLRSVTVNPNLKNSGFLVTPNPASNTILVQFYPQPTDLQAIQIYNAAGQKLAETRVNAGQASNQYTFDLSRFATGVYLVRAVFRNDVKVKKIIKH